MKPITTSASAQAAQHYGHEPILVLKIEWGGTGGTQYYSDKDIRIGSVAASGRLLEVGDIHSQKKQDNVGMVSVVRIKLDDSDNVLKAIIDNNAIEYKQASLYQWFDALVDPGDLTLLFKGNISGPISWSEADRTLSFEIETKIKDNEVGFSADLGSIQYLNPLAIDKAWPLVFGNTIHVPALKLITAPKGHLKYPFKGPRSDGTPPTLDPYNDDFHFYLLDSEGTTYFPQSTTIQVSIDGVIFAGFFEGDRFTVTDSNLPRYQNIAFIGRDSSDYDEINPFVAWISSNISIVNCYIYILDRDGNKCFLRVVRQEKNKIWFDAKSNFSGVTDTTNLSGLTAKLFTVGDTITEVAKNGRPQWGITENSTSITSMGFSAAPSTHGTGYTDMMQVVEIIGRVPWNFQVGTEVYLWQPAHRDIYVANLIPSTAIVAVYAKKRDKQGAEILTPIPSFYYTASLNNPMVVHNLEGDVTAHPTTLTFELPLQYYEGQSWSDEIYVTLRSTVGPNTSDIIKWVYDTYGSLSVDATSFATVRSLIDKYPSNFALFEKANVVSICDEIAWQARCGILLDNGSVFLRYLSLEPSVDVTYNESNIEEKTISLSFTRTEDIITSFRAQYKTTYYPEKQYEKEIFARNNIDKYGLHKKTYNFFIYNITSLVQKSVNFWSHRYANSWRTVSLSVALEALKMEIFDCVQLGLTDTSILNTSAIKSIVDSVGMNTSDDKIDFLLWLPSLAGTTTVDSGAWLSDASDMDPGDPTTKYLVNAFDRQLADLQSQLRIYKTIHSPTVPAEVISTVDLSGGRPSDIDTTGTPTVVNEYGNGFGNPPTRTNVVATTIDPAQTFEAGAKVAVASNNGRSHIITSGGSSFVPGRIVTNISDNLYSWKETDLPGGADKDGAVLKQAYEMNNSTAVGDDSFVFMFKASDGLYYFFYPVETCTNA